MLVPNLIIIAQRLLDERLRLRIESSCLTFPLLTLLLTSRRCLTHVLLILIHVFVDGSHISFPAGTKPNKYQHIRQDHYSRISQRTVEILQQERYRDIGNR